MRQLMDRAGVDFSSNDYLALSGDGRLRSAMTDAIAEGVATGAGGSRLLRGNDPEHLLLEEEAARHFGSQTCLYLANGFVANMALLSTLPQRGDLIIHDALIHASVHDGMRLSRAEKRAALHNDPQSVRDIITGWRRAGGTGRIWISVESLYSMDGDFAPLDDLVAIADEHDAILLVDEAHATGVYGPGGRGLSAHLEGRENVITLHTCGKALGVEGALVCGPAVMREFLVNYGRSFIFSTAPSPLMVRAVRTALQIAGDDDDRRVRLHDLVRHARDRLGAFPILPGSSQILALILGSNERAVDIAYGLQQAGFDVRAIRPPTVPDGTARLRISITLNAEAEDIDSLADHLKGVVS